ncbi:Tachykinin-like peptides receptor 86C [Pseudolycoriella hygida]|uniref:Tachykinin-like peptides receptor 86C n=1 Tax=Pseudolycoriella hygida TaxID=35572 RepID=A0A9Q0MZH5_9DIPT|nr:Tachykinin-like peptides receptor 86C [Pseudolycoriella hygida]
MNESIATNLFMKCMVLAMNYYQNNELRNASQMISDFNITDASTWKNAQRIYPHNEGDFMSECMKPSHKRPYEFSWEQKALWACLFGVMLMVAIVGNCIVIWIVLAHREMRTTTNYLLLNLSVADLLMSCLNCAFNFIYMLNSDWPFGTLYCSVNNFMGNATVTASVFTLVAISFDRYVAIVRPLHRRNSRKKARMFVASIWVLSVTLSLPGLLYSATESKSYSNGKSRTVCYLLWPDGRYPTSLADYVYNIVFLVLTYGIPMLIMVVCYSFMGKELWGSQSIGEHTERQRESVKSKKKVVRMFIAVVSIFGICWLPYHMFYVYAYHNPMMTSSAYVPHLFLGFYFLAMSNTMVNPIIYYWMNRKFRHYFQEVMCFCCFQLWKVNSINKTQDIYLHQNSVSMERKSKSFKLHTVDRQRIDSRSVRQTELNGSPKT